MQKTITVTVKNVYGNQCVYPSCDTSRFFCRLSGQKTITPDNMKLIKEMGYSVNITTPEL